MGHTWEGIAKEFAAIMCRDGGHAVQAANAAEDPDRMLDVVVAQFHDGWVPREELDKVMSENKTEPDNGKTPKQGEPIPMPDRPRQQVPVRPAQPVPQAQQRPAGGVNWPALIPMLAQYAPMLKGLLGGDSKALNELTAMAREEVARLHEDVAYWRTRCERLEERIEDLTKES